MSKLSRFKKAPVIRLPKKLPPPQPSRFESDDDDDDFVQKPIKYRESPSQKKLSSNEEEQRTPTSQQSVSEYFQPPKKTKANATRGKSGSASSSTSSKEPPPTNKETSRKKKTENPQVAKNLPMVKAPAPAISNDNESDETTSASKPKPDAPGDKDSENQGKVVCPFCWKKLGDTLTGTTHVKACAKDMPIERVFEAMQLQEKQIQEWERLGLEFPGFNPNNGKKNTKNAAGAGPSRGRGGGGGRNRNKKAATADPELELAVALSMSLHEEIESRHQKENQFLIENGLEKEIGLAEVKPKATVAVGKIPDQSVRANILPPPSVPNGGGRRRGKKVQLDKLPLYTVDSEQKKAIICERVTRILDESEQEENHQFYVRKEIPANSIGVPKRLMQFQDKESTLWTMAQAGLDTPNESFSVLELPDHKESLELTSYAVKEETETPCNPPSDTQKSCSSAEAKVKNCHGSNQKLIKDETTHPNPEAPLTKVEVAATKSKKFTSSLSSSGSGQSSIAKKSLEALKNLPRILQDITEMLILRKDCDMALYGREEKAIKCHSFMLAARCPQLLKNAIEEKSGKSTRRVIPLTDFSHQTVKAFLWYIYTGEWDRDYEEDLVLELTDLAEAFGMDIVRNEGDLLGRNELKCNYISVDVEVQTDRMSMQDISTNTECLDKSSLETGFESIDEDDDGVESQELFTTFFEVNAVELPKPKKDIEAKDKIQSAEDEHDVSSTNEDEDAQSDVDLFEDIENDLKSLGSFGSENKDPVKLKVNSDENLVSSPRPHLPPLQPDEENSEGQDSMEEDDFMKELTSPVTWNSGGTSEKKRSRSRSVSPIEYEVGCSYSATQIANILHQDQDTGKKAIKKQKLDYSDLDLEEGVCDKNSGSGDDVRSSPVLEENFKDKLIFSGDNNGNAMNNDCDDSFLLKISYDVANTNQKASVTPKNNLLKSRRSVSTPNLSINSPNDFNSSPMIYNLQDSGSDSANEPDPFADAIDDSVFANIPDEIWVKKKTPEPMNSMSGYQKGRAATGAGVSQFTSQKSLTPTSRSRRQISPRDLSTCENDFSISKRGAKKGRGNGGRAKAPPKMRLPRKQPASKEKTNVTADGEECDTLGEISHKEVTFMSQQPSRSRPDTATMESTSTSGNSKSPMLNYSLIDTPILKNELKKFGIKPLPRSKAKVLLRHIYKETHK